MVQLYSQEYPGISFSGHSLGGGLASANALKTGGKAVTFNPAAISENTRTNLKLNKDADIQNYVIRGELVDYLQWNLLGVEPVGDTHYIDAKYSADPSTNFKERLNNHYMKNILEYFKIIEYEKKK